MYLGDWDYGLDVLNPRRLEAKSEASYSSTSPITVNHPAGVSLILDAAGQLYTISIVRRTLYSH